MASEKVQSENSVAVKPSATVRNAAIIMCMLALTYSGFTARRNRQLMEVNASMISDNRSLIALVTGTIDRHRMALNTLQSLSSRTMQALTTDRVSVHELMEMFCD